MTEAPAHNGRLESSATPASRPIYIRPSSHDLGEMPLEFDRLNDACAALTSRQGWVWMRLVRHLWANGELPASPRRLAEISGVGQKTFVGMMPALQRLFDHDCAGRWTDVGLVEKRRLRLNLDSTDLVSFEEDQAVIDVADTVDPELRRKRQEAGRKGAAATHKHKRIANDLPSENLANLPSADGKTSLATLGALPSVLPPPSGPRAPDGLTDCSSSSEEKSTVSQSDSYLNGAEASAKDGKNSSNCAGKARGNFDGKIAIGSDGKMPSDQMVAEVVKRAVAKGGGTLDTAWQSIKCMETLHAAIADGCDLERHYEPALLTFTQRTTDKRIRHPACDPIMRSAWDLRERDRQDSSGRGAQRPDVSKMGELDRLFHTALETAVGTDAYISWFGMLLVEGVAGNVATVTVTTPFVRQYIDKTFDRQLLAAAKDTAPDADIRRVDVRVRSEASRATPSETTRVGLGP